MVLHISLQCTKKLGIFENFLHWPLLVVKRLNGHQALVSIVYSMGQALAAGPTSKFNYFQLHGSVL